jgi:progressive ankylosis protein
MGAEPFGGATPLKPVLDGGRIFRFWFPLAITWSIMAVEVPFISALISRLPEPVENLAAFGLALSISMVLECPVVALLPAAVRLARDERTFARLHLFAILLLIGVLVGTLVFTLSPALPGLAETLIGVSPELARRVQDCMLTMVPFPVAIGYRRLFQGVLIRRGFTRRVALGTLVRLAAMAGTALACFFLMPSLAGALMGGLSLSMGTSAEALATRLMVRWPLRALRAEPAVETLHWGPLIHFYYPLVLMSILGSAVQPLVSLALGQALEPLASLAVFPVVLAFGFVFRSLAISYQEVAIALLGERNEGYEALRRFAWVMALAMLAALVLIGFTPLAHLTFQHLLGLSPPLADLAVTSFQITILYPPLTVWSIWQRALMVHARRTGPITVAVAAELIGTCLLLYVTIHVLSLIGTEAAAWALVLGRLVGIAWVVPYTWRRPRLAAA